MQPNAVLFKDIKKSEFLLEIKTSSWNEITKLKIIIFVQKK